MIFFSVYSFPISNKKILSTFSDTILHNWVKEVFIFPSSHRINEFNGFNNNIPVTGTITVIPYQFHHIIGYGNRS